MPNEIATRKPRRGATSTNDRVCLGVGSGFSIRRQLALGPGITTDILELQLAGLNDAATATSIAVAGPESLAPQLRVESAALGWPPSGRAANSARTAIRSSSTRGLRAERVSRARRAASLRKSPIGLPASSTALTPSA